MYRTIDAKFWHDQKIRKLSRDGRYFVLYLVTNPHSHLSGLYYLPTVTVSHETGLKKSELDTLWHTISSAGLAYRDDENQVVWVVNMLSYQGRGSKNAAAAVKQAQLLSDSPLVARFVDRYPQFADRVSIGYPSQDQFGTPEQEQERDQEQETRQRAAEEIEPDPMKINLPSILDNVEFAHALSLWQAYKKERRESYKPSGLSGVISAAASKAEKFGLQSVIDAMETARANNWAGWDQKSLFGNSNGNQQSKRVGAGQRYQGD